MTNEGIIELATLEYQAEETDDANLRQLLARMRKDVSASDLMLAASVVNLLHGECLPVAQANPRLFEIASQMRGRLTIADGYLWLGSDDLRDEAGDAVAGIDRC